MAACDRTNNKDKEPQGFLGAFNSMQQLIDKLLEAGVLQKNEAAK